MFINYILINEVMINIVTLFRKVKTLDLLFRIFNYEYHNNG